MFSDSFLEALAVCRHPPRAPIATGQGLLCGSRPPSDLEELTHLTKITRWPRPLTKCGTGVLEENPMIRKRRENLASSFPCHEFLIGAGQGRESELWFSLTRSTISPLGIFETKAGNSNTASRGTREIFPQIRKFKSRWPEMLLRAGSPGSSHAPQPGCSSPDCSRMWSVRTAGRWPSTAGTGVPTRCNGSCARPAGTRMRSATTCATSTRRGTRTGF